MEENKTPVISGDARKVLEKDFAQLQSPVTVMVFTDDRENLPFNEFTVSFVRELAEITDKIRPKFEKIGGEASEHFGITRSPTLLIGPEQYDIRFIGAPSGEEARTLLLAIVMVSTGQTILTDPSRDRLADLKGKRNVKVFVSLTCPYCPEQAALAVAAAVEKKGLVTTEIIEIFENRELASQYNALSVPQTFIDDNLVGLGLQPEEVFIEELITAAHFEPRPSEHGESKGKDLVIIGAGPAGLTAAIYAERSGMKSVVLEKAAIGGQVALTPIVENYPGFTKIGGKTLMDMIAQQAAGYADIHQGEEVLDIRRTDSLFEVSTTRTKYTVKAVLITSGAESKKLGVSGEKEFQGRGISYCAACDGYFFKGGKKVIVVGGGNTAATEALYLKNIGVEVSIVHRRDQLRAEAFLQRSLTDNQIPIIWNSVVKDIKGNRLVTEVVLENTTDKTVKTVPVDGVFIAIGYAPNNELAKMLGLEMDDEGYIKVDSKYRTSMKGIYAAGDVTGGVKQIVTAVGQAAVAVMTIFEDIANPYWKEHSV